MLKYKAENEGKTYIEVDSFFPSSKTCHVCLNQVDSLPLDVRNWTCEHCHTNHDRDINASINIRNEALRILSLGTSDTAKVGNVRRLGGKISCLLDAIHFGDWKPQLYCLQLVGVVHAAFCTPGKCRCLA